MPSARWKSIMAVVTDPFSREQPAATKAAAIAARSGAKLTLFNAFMLPQPPFEAADVRMESAKQVVAAAIRQRRERLQQLAARLRKPGVVIRSVVEWDFPAHEAIVRHVLRARPDLVVAESHRHGRIARWVLANTDWELIRSCPAPLWFVRTASLPRTTHVMVAVDPHHAHAKPARLDDRLLAAANMLVEQLGGAVRVAHAYRSPANSGPATVMEPLRWPLSPERSRAYVADTLKSVRKLAAKHGVDAADCHVEEGEPSEVLARLTKRRKVDVLMMGAVSRSLIMRPVIGNTAERVIDRIGCDVFVVKPAGYKTPVRRASAKL